MLIVRYTPDRFREWDEFINGSKNGTFLFLRGYMDYHSDRFKDHSLMYLTPSKSPNGKGKLIAVLPANERNDALYSHQGLTYGGFIVSYHIHTEEVKELFELTFSYLKRLHFNEWYYKAMPTIYHRLPAEEDEYWLWRYNAKIMSCGLSSTINLQEIGIASPRKNSYRNQLKKNGYILEWNSPLSDFWPILEQNLMESHHLKPVHNIEEITILQKKFPENIVCCITRNPNGIAEAGTVLFITNQVVHTQYISASKEGKSSHAIDHLMFELIDKFRKEGGYRYFDFGISTEDQGEFLNEGLCLQKEGFGGRGVLYKQYKLEI